MISRATYDPFAYEHRQWRHRVRVVNQYGIAVSERKVPAGADLRAEFYAELVRLAQEGWFLEEPFKGACFILRGNERWHVTIARD